MLQRANLTVDKILEKVEVSEHKIHKDWRLNERHYGALTGLNKGFSNFQIDKGRIHSKKKVVNFHDIFRPFFVCSNSSKYAIKFFCRGGRGTP